MNARTISARCTATTTFALALSSAALAQTVAPTSINTPASPTCGGGSEMHNVCITLPPGSIVDEVMSVIRFDFEAGGPGEAAAASEVKQPKPKRRANRRR